MGSNFKIWWSSERQAMPLVQRDIRHFSALRNSMHSNIESDRSCGRFARSDDVASCLLRKDYADAMPIRREVLVARNRRRLRLLFALMIVCWMAGRFFV